MKNNICQVFFFIYFNVPSQWDIMQGIATKINKTASIIINATADNVIVSPMAL